jgi:outer membrane protein assembly factor BamE (lipoprotein component of BamABCDE complex)
MGYVRALMLTAIVCVSTSCIVVPIPKTAGIRGPIRKDALAFLKKGPASREDVLLHLGIPEDIFNKEKIFDYKWIGAWEIGYLGPAGSDSWKKYTCHVLRFHFDEHGIVESLYIDSYDPKRLLQYNSECYFHTDTAKPLDILKH